MLQFIAEELIFRALQVLGWVLLKAVSLNQYRGFRTKDEYFEAGLGFIVVATVTCGVYLWR